jgi:selenocysteine lyase/cysteine desulfurase
VLDITQSGGAMPIDVAKIEPDFLVCACYKWLLGPYAIGFLYVNPKWQQGLPLEQGWIARKDSQDFTRLIDYQNEYHPGAVRFDMGERSSFQLMPMAEAALRQILDWGVENIYQKLSALTETIAHGAQQHGFSSAPIGQRAGHYLGLRAPHGLPDTLTADLGKRQIYVSVRGDSLRVTPHLYNTPEDCERLLNALAELT